MDPEMTAIIDLKDRYIETVKGKHEQEKKKSKI